MFLYRNTLEIIYMIIGMITVDVMDFIRSSLFVFRNRTVEMFPDFAVVGCSINIHAGPPIRFRVGEDSRPATYTSI